MLGEFTLYKVASSATHLLRKDPVSLSPNTASTGHPTSCLDTTLHPFLAFRHPGCQQGCLSFSLLTHYGHGPHSPTEPGSHTSHPISPPFMPLLQPQASQLPKSKLHAGCSLGPGCSVLYFAQRPFSVFCPHATSSEKPS